MCARVSPICRPTLRLHGIAEKCHLNSPRLNKASSEGSILGSALKQVTGQQCALWILYLISIKDLVESSRTVRHSHRQRWEGWGGHLWESTNCSVYSFHGRQKPVRLMWNDDLAHSVTGDWRQLGASGSRRGAEDGPKTARALMEPALWAGGESPTCGRSPGPARHLNDGIWDNEATRDDGDKTSPSHGSGKARAMTGGARDREEVKQRKVV